MLNNIINDLRNLEGKQVGSGYFKHIYSNEVDATTINILDVLESLKPYEFDTENLEILTYVDDEEGNCEEEYKIVDMDEFLEWYEYEEVTATNSYNWSAPISNHFNYTIYQSRAMDNCIVEFKVHRFGDVRCNYTEKVYLKFEDEYDFYDVIRESNKYFTIEDKENNIEYYVCIDIFSECPTIEKTLIEECETEYLEGYEAYELLENIIGLYEEE